MKMRGRVQRNQDTKTGANPNKFAENLSRRLSAKRPGKLSARLGGILLAAAMLLTLLPGAAASAASSSVTATIPISQTVTANGSSGDKKSFTYTLTPEESSNPMPEGTKDNAFSVKVTGNQDTGIKISYDTPGTYYYNLSLVKPSGNGYTYDSETSYRIGVQVLDEKDENGAYKANVFAYKSNGMKAQLVVRINYKQSGKTPQPTPKANPGTPSRASKTGLVKTGDSSQIGLYEGLLAAAGAALIVLIVWRRRKRA